MSVADSFAGKQFFSQGAFDALEFGIPSTPAKARGAFRVTRVRGGFNLAIVPDSGGLTPVEDSPVAASTAINRLDEYLNNPAAAKSRFALFGVVERKAP